MINRFGGSPAAWPRDATTGTAVMAGSVLVLPGVLDLGAAAPLRSLLLAHRGAALVIDAAGVRHMGGLCLQVLLAAQAAWREDGLPFLILSPSPVFSDVLCLTAARQLGIPPPVSGCDGAAA
jgi:chemotaxis protein CheX